MPSKPYNETHLKKRIYKTLDIFPGIFRRKLSNPFRAGVLDYYILYHGRSVWLEAKVIPNTLTPLQKKEIQEIRSAGGLAFGLFADPGFNAFYLYKNDFDTVEFGNLTDLLTEVLTKEVSCQSN